MSTLKRKDLKFLPIQSNTVVLWHKFICHLLDAGQRRQMPKWTGCVTCPHLQTTMNKTTQVREKTTTTTFDLDEFAAI